MSSFSGFRVSAVFNRGSSTLDCINAMKKNEKVSVCNGIQELVNWKFNQQFPFTFYPLGFFTCRNAVAHSMTDSYNLQTLLGITLKGFIVEIKDIFYDNFKVRLETLEKLGIINSFVLEESSFSFTCFGGNRVGLAIGLLRDYGDFNLDTILKVVSNDPDYAFIVGLLKEKEYTQLHNTLIYFLNATNTQNRSIHDSWEMFLEGCSVSDKLKYVTLLKKYCQFNIELTYKEHIFASLDGHITRLNKIAPKPGW